MSESATKASAKACPNCGKPAIDEFRPFCSAHCKNVDLHRWLSETYRVPETSGRSRETDGADHAESSKDDWTP